jgi:uncharacterized membrane protein YesL
MGANMLKSNPPYAIWSIWLYLPPLPKLFFLALCVLGVYCLFSAAITMVRLRTIPRLLHKKENVASVQRALAALRKRSTNLQNLIGAAFYLFGLVLFLGLQLAYSTLENSSTPLGLIVLQTFAMYFAFAANVFLVFLILHFVQWFVSGRMDAWWLQVDAQQTV